MVPNFVFADSPRCWAVAISMMVYTFFAMAVMKSSSVLYVGSMQMLDLSRQEASWPATLAVMLSQLAGPAYGIMQKYMPERMCLIIGALLCSLPMMGAAWANDLVILCALVGVVQGFGAACSEVIPFVVLMRHFQRYRGTVISAMYIITAVSGFAMPVLFEYVRQTWNFRICLFVMGVMNLGMLLGCIIVNRVSVTRESIVEEGKPPAEHFAELTISSDAYMVGSILLRKSQVGVCSSITLEDIIRLDDKLVPGKPDVTRIFHHLKVAINFQYSLSGSFVQVESLRERAPLISMQSIEESVEKASLFSWSFIHITISRAATVFALAAFLLILLDYTTDRQLDSVQGVFVLTVFTIGDLMSRVLSGSLIDLRVVSNALLMSTTFFIQGGSYLLLIYTDIYAVMLVAATLLGLTGGCRNILATVMVTEKCEESSLALNLGIMNFVTGITIFFQPALIGYVRDSLGSYEPLLFGFVICNLILSVTWFIEVLCDCRKRRQGRLQ